MFDAPEAGVRGAGGLHFRNAQQTTTVFAGGLCNTSLQSPHLMPRQRKVTVGGGVWNHTGASLAGFRSLCKEQLVAFAISKEKMEQKWTKVLVLVVFCQRKFVWTLRSGPFVALGAIYCCKLLSFLSETTSGGNLKEEVVKEGAQVDIHCQPSQSGSLTVWFRVRDKSWMEFIASFSNGLKKETDYSPSTEFTHAKINKDILTLKSFQREADSGLYCCASLFKGKELRFGQVTQLRGGELSDFRPLTLKEEHLNRPGSSSPQKRSSKSPRSLKRHRGNDQ